MKQRSTLAWRENFSPLVPSKPDLGVLGRKWVLLILADIGLRRVDRFSGLLRSNPKLNSRILSRRLGELEEAGMIRRREKNLVPRPIRWTMTEKGMDIFFRQSFD